MDGKQKTYEFGPNGSILNNDAMSPELESEYRRANFAIEKQLGSQVWPTSAWMIAFASVFLFGMIFGSQDPSSALLWIILGAPLLMLLALWWRETLKRRDRG